MNLCVLETGVLCPYFQGSFYFIESLDKFFKYIFPRKNLKDPVSKKLFQCMLTYSHVVDRLLVMLKCIPFSGIVRFSFS